MIGNFPRHSEAKRIILDIETFDPLLKTKGVSYVYNVGYILGIGIKLDNSPAVYYPLRHEKRSKLEAGNGSRPEIEQVYNYLRDIHHSVNIVGHYSIYDIGWIMHESDWLHEGKIQDTLLMAQLENNARDAYSLNKLSQHFHVGEKIEVDPQKLYQLPLNEVARYCCQDVELTARLDAKLWKFHDTVASEREFEIIPILAKMKHKGIRINIERLEDIEQYLTKFYRQLIYDCGIEDIWAARRVAELFNELGISYPKTDLGSPSFPSWYLESIDHPQIKALHKARQIYRLQGFCQGIRDHLTKDSRLHPDFFNGRSEFGGTITGRFSSGNPNIQQMPHRTEEGRLLRSIFVPDEGHVLFKFDYKQQEPILMLHYASKLNLPDIERWREIYKAPDADFYIPIQTAMSISRFEAKTYSLARSYGMGPEKLSLRQHIKLSEAMKYLIGFDQVVPWMKSLKEHCTSTAINRGWIKTIGERQLYFSRKDSSNAFNHLIQGSAADQIKEAMVLIHHELGLVPLLQVHDELLFQLTREQINQGVDKEIEQCMIRAFKLDFPTRVDVKPGLNWDQCG